MKTSPYSGAGYRMIDSLDITNFRCFGRLKLSNFRRVNVVTGSNASGKTALIEALYLGANATGAALQRINSGRSHPTAQAAVMIAGVGPFPINQGQSLEASFDHLFRSARKEYDDQLTLPSIETAQKIEIAYSDSDQVKYRLSLAYQGRGDDTPVPVVRQAGGLSAAIPLILDRVKTSPTGLQQNSPIPVTFNQFGQLQHPPALPFGPATMMFGPTMDYAEIDDVTWFSQLKERNESEKVVSFIKKEFPFVKDIEVLAPAGISGLYAAMDDGTTRRVTAVSSGIYKIISILLACAHTRGGVILIDEIENGIFYEKFQAVWKIIYRFALDTNNQIFVSTHSAECLSELVGVIGDSVDDFCLLRAERENDCSTVRHISGTAMVAALKGSNEIRGATLGFEGNNP